MVLTADNNTVHAVYRVVLLCAALPRAGNDKTLHLTSHIIIHIMCQPPPDSSRPHFENGDNKDYIESNCHSETYQI